MAHFAELDENKIVTQVIVVSNAELIDNGVESEAKGIAFCASLFGHDRWKQTSYNGNIRKNYAGVGYTYDAQLNAFVAPRPYQSWTLDTISCQWKPPVPYPEDGGRHVWHEASKSWLPAE